MNSLNLIDYIYNNVVGYPDFWPEALDGLLSTIADLAESIQEFVTATERAANYDSYQGEYSYMWKGHLSGHNQ